MRAGDWERLAMVVNAVLVTLGCVVIVGLLVRAADDRLGRIDLTQGGRATLTADTRSVLVQLQDMGVVEITAFAPAAGRPRSAEDRRDLEDLVADLREAAPWIQARMVDLDADRLTAERLGVKLHGTVVVQRGADRVDLLHRELIHRRGGATTFGGEQAVAAALRALLSPRRNRVGVTVGHGERSLFDRGLGELVAFRALLDAGGFTAQSVDLAAGDLAVDLVVVGGPRHAFTPAEEEELERFLEGGGSALILVEPDGAIPRVLERMGVSVPRGFVTDPAARFPFEDAPRLLVAQHEGTGALAEEEARVHLSHGAPLVVVPVSGVESSVLLSTGRLGWMERGRERPASFDPEVDGAGPVVAGLALQQDGARVVVLGDADLLTDSTLSGGGANASFLAGALRWALDRPSAPGAVTRGMRRSVVLTEEDVSWIRVLTCLLIPGVLLVLGVVVRRIRRAA